MSRVNELLLALGLPLLLLVGFTLLLEQQQGRLPGFLEPLARRSGRLWTIGIGLIIGLNALRYLLGR
jgi:hypothetical protein